MQERALVAELEDIIRSKEHANRDKDREALPELQALLATQRSADRGTSSAQAQQRQTVERPRNTLAEPMASEPASARRYRPPPRRGPSIER